MDLRQYNTLQAKIFKRYKLECMVVNDIVRFNILCSKIAEKRNCNLCYSTIKSIIVEVRKIQKGDDEMCYIREIKNFNNLKDLKIKKEGVSECVLINYVDRFVYGNRVYSRYYVATDDFETTLNYKDIEFKKGELFLIDDDDNVVKGDGDKNVNN